MYRKRFMKMAAVLLAAACTVTAVPQAAFADELISNDPVLLADELTTAEDEAPVNEDEEVASGDEAAAFDEDDILNDSTVEAEVFGGNDAAAPEEDDLEADREVEAELNSAKVVKLDTEVTGKATETQKAYFKFTPEKTGRYELTGTSDDKMTVRVFDGDKYVESRTDGCYYWHRQYTTILDNTGAQGNRVDLIGGKTCYIVVENASLTSEINFNFTVSLLYEVTLYEKDAPVSIAFNKEYTGHFAPDAFMNSDNEKYEYVKNCYKFHMDKAGSFTFHIEDDSTIRKYPYKTFTTYRICNDLNDMTASDPDKNNMFWNWTTNTKEKYGEAESHNTWFDTGDESDEGRISLLAGDYYIIIEGDIGTTYDNSLTYKFILKDLKYLEKKAGEEDPLVDTRLNGSNDEMDFRLKDYGKYYEKEGMPVIYPNKTYRGILTEDSLTDCYYFKLEKDSPLYLDLESDIGIGNCIFDLAYYSEKEDVFKMYFLDKSYVSTPDVALGSEQMQNHNGNPKNHPTFMAGEYVIMIRSVRYNDSGKKIHQGMTGQYKFRLSTGKTTGKPVSSLKLDNKNNVIALGKGETAVLTATVGPKTASDTSVNFTVEPAGIIEVTQKEPEAGEKVVPGETKLKIEALAESGEAKITIKTNAAGSKGSPLEATCMVSVIPSSVCDQPIAVREKINLGGATYFNTSEITNGDKFDIIPENPKDKSVGSVSNGVFTAKKPGKVSIIWRKKIDSKTFVPQKKVTIDLKMPSYKKDEKGKDIKASAVIPKKGIVVKPEDWLLDLDDPGTVKPNHYEIPKNAEKNFSINEAGEVTVLGTGSCKVTAYYGYDLEAAKSSDPRVAKTAAKNASKIDFTIKSKLPTVKDAKVKPNKPGDKTKTVTIAVSNLPKDYMLKAADWKVKKTKVEDGKITYTTEDAEFEYATVATKENHTKCNVTIPAGAAPEVIAVVVTVDGVEYPSYVTIQQF